jgi:hypothetical protein
MVVHVAILGLHQQFVVVIIVVDSRMYSWGGTCVYNCRFGGAIGELLVAFGHDVTIVVNRLQCRNRPQELVDLELG